MSLLRQSSLLSIIAIIMLSFGAAPVALAQASPSTSTTVESTAGYPYFGKVTASELRVRCGAGTNYYRVGKMLKWGEVVRVHKLVTNNQGSWLAITPPEGQYLLISSKFVERQAGGTQGIVMGNRINVRAPSPAGPDKSWKILTQVSSGTPVRILGQDGDWLHIAPLEGAYFYVSSKYIQRASKEDLKKHYARGGVPGPRGSETGPIRNTDQNDNEVRIIRTSNDGQGDSTTLTVPATQPSSDTVEVKPTPKPNEDLIAAEEQFEAASQKPVSQQPVNKLIALYETIADQELMDSEKKLVKMRLELLNTRAKLQKKLAQLRSTQDELQETQQRQQDEQRRQEVLDKKEFIAVGMLKTSAVYDGKRLPLRLRLVDQTTKLTVAYVALPENFEYSDKINQLVGLTGETKFDDSVKLKVIYVSEIIKLGARE